MKQIIAIAVLASASIAAQAQGFYLGVGVGVSKAENDLKGFNAEMVEEFGGSISSTQDSSIRSFRLVGGYKANENIAIELGYSRSAKWNLNYAGRTGNNVAYSGGGNVRTDGFDVSAVVRPSVASGFNNFFATAGVHNYQAEVGLSFSADGTRLAINGSERGTGTMFGAGYDWKARKDLDVRLLVRRLNKVAGESGSANNFFIGLNKHF